MTKSTTQNQHGDGSPLPRPSGSVQLSGELPMNRTDYDKLKLSGMMWEIYPDFTGDYDEDILSQNVERSREG